MVLILAWGPLDLAALCGRTARTSPRTPLKISGLQAYIRFLCKFVAIYTTAVMFIFKLQILVPSRVPAFYQLLDLDQVFQRPQHLLFPESQFQLPSAVSAPRVACYR